MGQIGSLEGADGQLSKVILKGAEGEEILDAGDALLPFFGLTMKLGPVADWGLDLDREPDRRRYREVRDVGARYLRHRRYQYLSGQVEADPLRLP